MTKGVLFRPFSFPFNATMQVARSRLQIHIILDVVKINQE